VKDYKTCPFNARHVIPSPEFEYHIKDCPDRVGLCVCVCVYMCMCVDVHARMMVDGGERQYCLPP